MTRLPFMQVFVGELLSTTSHLSLEQRGGFYTLLFAMWNGGGSLPSDPAKLARICGVSLKRWNVISPDVLAFFRVDGDRLTQDRLSADYERGVSLTEKRRAAGVKGNSVKSLKSHTAGSANANANAEQTSRKLESEPEPYSEREERKISQKLATQEVLPRTAKPPRKRKALIELPNEWVLSNEQWQFGATLGLTEPELEQSQRKLKRWVKQQGKRCADWNSFIEQWLENEISFLRKSGPHNPSGTVSGYEDFLKGTIT